MPLAISFCLLRAYVLDSGAGSTKVFAQQVIEDLGKFFSAVVGSNVNFDPVFIRVNTNHIVIN